MTKSITSNLKRNGTFAIPREISDSKHPFVMKEFKSACDNAKMLGNNQVSMLWSE